MAHGELLVFAFESGREFGEAVAGCAAAVTSGAYFGPEVNLSAYDTYAWGPADALPTGDPRVDNNEFFDAQVRAAVERHLHAKGLRKVASDSAVLLIHYHATVDEKLDVFTVDRDYGYYSGYGLEDHVEVYEEGTLLVDMVDPESNTLVWRSWAQTNIEGLLDDQSRMEERIDEGVAKMFAQFPAATAVTEPRRHDEPRSILPVPSGGSVSPLAG